MPDTTLSSIIAAALPDIVGYLDFKGNLDCAANPNYPAASKGDVYVVSVAGKIGGGSGTVVAVGDSIIAKADNAGGTQAAVGTNWFVLQRANPDWTEIVNKPAFGTASLAATGDFDAAGVATAVKTGAMGVVVHGSTAGTARPAGYGSITWIGSVEPTNMVNNDIWHNTSV